jgi:TonB-dependent receptor
MKLRYEWIVGSLRSTLLLAFLFGFVGALHPGVLAQGTGMIRGKIVDRSTGDVLPGANVVIVGTSFGASSGLDGAYVIYGVPAGAVKLRASYVGYSPVTVDVTVTANATLEQVFRLSAEAIEGETVVVTAQAQGQNAAINQQLSSNTITNVVSSARIKELPDVNAAESIGRLPGVSINRSGGEANNVAIRGLSAKYNLVTVNGTRMPSTGDDRGTSLLSSVANNGSPDARYGGNDRSVDLSMISSNSLDGIELKKANTPDMDADVLGGTIDLRLKEAQEGFHSNLSVQGGYNKLQKYYGNFNLAGSVSNRFLDNSLGIIVSGLVDKYDRSADKFSGSYRQVGLSSISIESLNLREEKVKRGRTGANMLLDYQIPNGIINANILYARLKWDGTYRVNSMNVSSVRHYYDAEQRQGTTDELTSNLSVSQDWEWIKFDVGASRTGSWGKSPDERGWHFSQETGTVFGNTAGLTAIQIPDSAKVDTLSTRFADAYVFDTRRNESQNAVQFNVTYPLRFGDIVSGYLKAGAKFRWLDRLNDEEVRGTNNNQYGGGSSSTIALIHTLSMLYPGEWDYLADSARTKMDGGLSISRFLTDYSRKDFLNGDYPIGLGLDLVKLNHLTEALKLTPSVYQRYTVQSMGRDYDGVEHYQAAYVMGEFNVGNLFTFIPGARWERENSEYHGERYRAVATGGAVQGAPLEYTPLTVNRTHEYWLPMVHLIVKPADWMKVRLARTETLTRPDFRQYAPITYITGSQDQIVANNSELKPARAVNLDLSVSVFSNDIGLFTASAFHKKISDMIFSTRYNIFTGIPPPPGSNIPASWLAANAPIYSYDMNNPYPAYVKGLELEWQTHFWYLPGVLKGLVFNINYTVISSKVEIHSFVSERVQIRPAPPIFAYVLRDTSRTSRVPDQPARILNLTLGFDYEGFSTRLSYLFQTDRVTGIGTNLNLDSFTGDYARWDLTIQQSLFDWGVQLFANLSNLSGRPDQSYRGYQLTDPTYIEYYGFTMDVGARFRF